MPQGVRKEGTEEARELFQLALVEVTLNVGAFGVLLALGRRGEDGGSGGSFGDDSSTRGGGGGADPSSQAPAGGGDDEIPF